LTGAGETRRGRTYLTRAAVASCAALACGAVAGCGGSGPTNRIHGTRLTIYASVPLEGASRIDAQAALNGARMALAAISGRIGRYRIEFRALDDATAKTGAWDPGQTEDNARLAAADRTAIGYIGDLDSGASAISIPLLNRAGIAQVSPASTAVGLTSDAPGASPGEPQKYYPTKVRTYARLVPDDNVQAAAQVELQRSLGCSKTYVVDDGEVDGLDMAMSFNDAAERAGLQVVGVQAFQPHATDYTSFASTVAASGADCILLSALTESGAALVTRQLAAALPHARIFGTALVAESTYTDPTLGGIPLALDRRVLITVATLDPRAYPPDGRSFFVRYAQLYGAPQPYSIFGYEAMSLMLDAISRSTGGGTRAALRSRVVAAIFATRDRHSVLGTYSIDSDGDTSLRRYGVWRVVDGQLVFWKAITG
jgi:branched-chain amino acid transport system substrate-binding protein